MEWSSSDTISRGENEVTDSYLLLSRVEAFDDHLVVGVNADLGGNDHGLARNGMDCRVKAGNGALKALADDDEARAGRQHAHVRPPHADIAPTANPAAARPLIGARAAAIDRPTADAAGHPLAIFPHLDRGREVLVLNGPAKACEGHRASPSVERKQHNDAKGHKTRRSQGDARVTQGPLLRDAPPSRGIKSALRPAPDQALPSPFMLTAQQVEMSVEWLAGPDMTSSSATTGGSRPLLADGGAPTLPAPASVCRPP
jgi:hypothetical protein